MGWGEPSGGPGRLCELKLRGQGVLFWGAVGGVGVTLPREYPSPPRCAQSSLDPLLSFLALETFSAKEGGSKGPCCWTLSIDSITLEISFSFLTCKSGPIPEPFPESLFVSWLWQAGGPGH